MPPLTGVAVNVTLVPVQIVFPGSAMILTEGVDVGFTVIVIPLEVTVAGLTHASVEVITAVITSPFTKDAFW
jgi:hypothetical protein